MKKIALVATSLLFVSSAAAEDAWIQVRETKLRSQPMYFAPVVGSLKFGDRVSRISEDQGWVQVRTLRKMEGFLPLSCITRQQVVFSGSDVSKVEADSAEVVLAGKGFSKEVEAQYKRGNSSARFDLVDQVERSGKVSPGEVLQFVKAGGLKG